MAEIHHGETRALTTFEHSFSQGNRTRSFLKVQDGCDYSCTFCTIPGARGASRSGNPHDLLQQAKDLVASGVREIVLTGVNTGDYGWVGGDLNRGPSRPLGNFGDLLSLLAEESGAERLRISSVEPNLLTDRIIELMKKHPNLMPHVHMPLQSGSDALLARMKRRYRSAQYADRVQAVRSALPHACIGVDVIVGFPGETDGLFMETHDFIRDLEVSYLHVFTYSERPGTEAAAMEGRVPNGRRSDRNRLLTHLGLRKRLDFAQSHLGSMRPVLFEQERKGQWMQGYTDNYIRVSAPYNPLWINRIVPVELASVEADGTVLCRLNASDQLMAEDHFVFQP
jgi:threonylcarbamoyladenosine tRNA methylthiotransferase MtaB